MTPLAVQRLNCRICKSTGFEQVLDFGDMALTGVFLKEGNRALKAPLNLVRCGSCGLIQLEHTYSLDALYTESYGYESHLNGSMRAHLQSKALLLQSKYLANKIDPVVVDIASNDGTLLSGFSMPGLSVIGIDPLIDNVSDFYPIGASKVANFFTTAAFKSVSERQASLVTSLSVIYDLDDPTKFACDVAEILEENGVWHFEQSYLPTMVETLSYDTICHEHLLYLRLYDILTILKIAGLQIIDASLNSINGGSIAVTAIKSKSKVIPDPFVEYLLEKEKIDEYVSGSRLKQFALDAQKHSSDLKQLLENYKNAGYEIYGLGASTKGNVLLQWCGLNSSTIQTIGDINSKKFGKQTPGTSINIVSENEVFDSGKNGVLAIVMPWHFRDGIVKNAEKFIANGGKLLFPLPRIEVVS
jgi:hypothetical protein